MSEPIKAGDRCIVVQGLGCGKSPNVGLTVTAGQLQGEHSKYGRVWRCHGKGIKQLADHGGYVDCGWADFPAAWLRKLPSVAANDKQFEQQEATA